MKRKISKRNSILLGIVAVAALGFAFYQLMYLPTMEYLEEQEERQFALEQEIAIARAYAASLENAALLLAELDQGIRAVRDTYYPLVEAQYFVDLLRIFSDDLELKISAIQVEVPSTRALSNLIPDESEDGDPLAEAYRNYARVTGTPESGGVGQGLMWPSTRPGNIILSEMTFYLFDGELEDYLRLLEKINNADRPIYVSQFIIAPKRNAELEREIEEAEGAEAKVLEFELMVTVMVIQLPYADDRGEFKFNVLPAEGTIESFLHGMYIWHQEEDGEDGEPGAGYFVRYEWPEEEEE